MPLAGPGQRLRFALFNQRSALFDLMVTVGVAGLTALVLFLPTIPRSTMAIGYLMAVALLARRRWPLSTMAVVSACGLAQVLLGNSSNDPMPYDVALLIAMYSTVKYGRRLRDGWLAAAAVAVGIGIEVYRHFNIRWWAQIIWYVGICSGVWLMGYTVRNRRIYVVGLEERAATLERERDHLTRIAVADERAVIARELHDVVAHNLAVMVVQADGGRYAFDTDPAAARKALATVAETGRDALEDMRQLVTVLRGSETGTSGQPEQVSGLGSDLHGDPERRLSTVDRLDALVERARSAGLDVSLDEVGEVGRAGAERSVTPAVELAIYRITQESLTNVLRHSGRSAKVTLTLRYHPDAVELQILDDGGDIAGRGDGDGAGGGGGGGGGDGRDGGMRANGRATTVGNGLIGMRERVAVYGGAFQAGPDPAGGWGVRARIPLRDPSGNGTAGDRRASR